MNSLLLDPSIKPIHRLQESLLFGQAYGLIAEVCAYGEAVFDARIQEHLVGLLCLLEDLFRFMAFVRGEDKIGFCLFI